MTRTPWWRIGGRRPRPVILCVLDGWGYREDPRDNAVALADTPVFDRCWSTLPRCLLRTDGPAVGLPEGQMGNSEVGHMNLGAGRVVLQDLPRIDRLIERGELERSGKIDAIAERVRAGTGRIHLLGLVSPGGVHAHQRHMAWLAGVLAARGLEVVIHAFTDGRDTPPRAAIDHLARLERDLAAAPGSRIATVSGRYYAMDRDRRWDRTRKAYEAIVLARGERAASFREAIERAYAAGLGDEFVLPTVIGDYRGMEDGDGVICTNFRADRVRQIMGALVDPEFDGFAREKIVRFSYVAGMMSYSRELDRYLDVLVPPEKLVDVFGEVVSRAGLTQFRIAETEKYPHVTYFFNGGREQPFAGEDRVLIPSPKVPTYDLQPEMSAEPVTDRLVQAIDSGRYDFVLINYANPDMVGHTGSLEAAIRAVETVDRCLGRMLEAVARQGGVALVTADHGNCEMMRDPQTGQPHTAHTRNPVPCFLFGLERPVRMRDGILADVAPTLLSCLELEQPKEMTGVSLVVEPS